MSHVKNISQVHFASLECACQMVISMSLNVWRLDKLNGNIIRHDYYQFNVHLPLQFALAISWVFIDFHGFQGNVEYSSNPRKRGEFGLLKTQL